MAHGCDTMLSMGFVVRKCFLPEAERAVGDRQLWPHIEPAPFQIEQQLAPILRTFTRIVREADELLATLRRRANQYQNALLLIFEPGLQVDGRRPRRRRSVSPTDGASAMHHIRRSSCP